MAKKCARTFSIVVEKGKKSILDVTHLLPDALPRSVPYVSRAIALMNRCSNLMAPPRARRPPHHVHHYVSQSPAFCARHAPHARHRLQGPCPRTANEP